MKPVWCAKADLCAKQRCVCVCVCVCVSELLDILIYESMRKVEPTYGGFCKKINQTRSRAHAITMKG